MRWFSFSNAASCPWTPAKLAILLMPPGCPHDTKLRPGERRGRSVDRIVAVANLLGDVVRSCSALVGHGVVGQFEAGSGDVLLPRFTVHGVVSGAGIDVESAGEGPLVNSGTTFFTWLGTLSLNMRMKAHALSSFQRAIRVEPGSSGSRGEGGDGVGVIVARRIVPHMEHVCDPWLCGWWLGSLPSWSEIDLLNRKLTAREQGGQSSRPSGRVNEMREYLRGGPAHQRHDGNPVRPGHQAFHHGPVVLRGHEGAWRPSLQQPDSATPGLAGKNAIHGQAQLSEQNTLDFTWASVCSCEPMPR